MNAKKIAACAIIVALLIAVQFALSFVSGVELVTVLLLCFCYTFGIVCGMLVATAFSLIRCFLFGFVPNVVLLYLIYYNLFALLFGSLKKHKLPVWVCPVLLSLLAAGSAYFAIAGIPISILYQNKIRIMFWILFGIAAALLLVYIVLILCHKKSKELASITALAAFCTVLFTLLDDLISPLLLGYGAEATLAYFYTSLLAMLPQTICASVSVFILFNPIKNILSKICPEPKKKPLIA